nr:MAG TPA: hypothetical protein [Caudoviricetes sp.]
MSHFDCVLLLCGCKCLGVPFPLSVNGLREGRPIFISVNLCNIHTKTSITSIIYRYSANFAQKAP